jgi:hypothetical protein
MPPIIIAVLLGAGLVALIPTRRLADRTADRWLVLAYYIALWLLLMTIVGAPGLRRFSVPLALLLAIAPFVTFRAGLDRLLGRRGDERRPPPRNVTPPDA